MCIDRSRVVFSCALLTTVVVLGGCGDSGASGEDAGVDASHDAADAGAGHDAGSRTDAGAAHDAGQGNDAGTRTDAGGLAADAGLRADAGRVCGGIAGEECAAGEFCKYDPEAMCGAADATGSCTPRPEVCALGVAEVCGCDGTTYASVCEANRAGTDVAHTGACATAPDCRTTGCSVGSYCSACLSAHGVVYACIPEGAAC